MRVSNGLTLTSAVAEPMADRPALSTNCPLTLALSPGGGEGEPAARSMLSDEGFGEVFIGANDFLLQL